MKIARVTEDTIRLNLFSFSLAGESKRWLHSFKGNSLRTREEVVEKFLKKYFPESKTAEGKVKISSFHEHLDESLSEALDRFHGLLRKTPTHGFSEPVQLNIFIDGLRPHSKKLLDASVGGKIKLNTPEEAMELIENMTASDHAILRDRAYTPTKKSLLELTFQDVMLAQNKLLAKTLENLTATLSNLPQQLHVVQPPSAMHSRGCNICGAHESSSCMVQPMRSTTWAVRIIKDSIKEDHQDSIREVIFRRARVGDLIQGIISTKEVHLINLPTKSPFNRRNPLSWRNCWYSLCRGPSRIRRVLMQQSGIWRYK